MRLLITTLFFLLSISGNVLSSEGAVMGCFEQYKMALIEKNGIDAVSVIDQNTTTYYNKILHEAKYGNLDQFTKAPIVDKILILRARTSIEKKLLKSMSGEDFFIYAVNENWVNASTITNTILGEITLDGKKASTKLRGRKGVLPIGFNFYLVKDQWKIDLTSITPTVERGIQNMIKFANLTEVEYLQKIFRPPFPDGLDEKLWIEAPFQG